MMGMSLVLVTICKATIVYALLMAISKSCKAVGIDHLTKHVVSLKKHYAYHTRVLKLGLHPSYGPSEDIQLV